MILCEKCNFISMEFDSKIRSWACLRDECGHSIEDHDKNMSRIESCPVCGCGRYVVVDMNDTESKFCLNQQCRKFDSVDNNARSNKNKRIIIEIKSGTLYAAYGDPNTEIILVDHDEFDGGRASSAVIIPDKMADAPEELNRLIKDAVERTKS